MDRRDTVRLSAGATNELLSFTGVVSVGVGFGPDGEPAVVVGVRQASATLITALPETIDDLPVVVREVGDLTAE